MTGEHHEPALSCASCPAPAAVCPECVRAIALQWFGDVARHPETGTGCQLCHQGQAVYCGRCFVGQVVGYRAVLLKAGVTIGEPAGRRP